MFRIDHVVLLVILCFRIDHSVLLAMWLLIVVSLWILCFVFSLLLHAKLQDHVTCTVIANIWLKNSNNFSLTDYQTIVELYVERVLVASHRWSDVRVFLDSCPGLSASSKDKYLRKINGFHQQYLESSADKIEVIEKSSESNSTPCQTSPSSHLRLTDADEESTAGNCKNC